MLDALTEHWEREGDPELLHMERFQPVIGGDRAAGTGGTMRFAKSGVEADVRRRHADPGRRRGGGRARCPSAAGWASATPASAGSARAEVRDLRTGEVHGSEGEMVRTCVNAPEGPIEIAL